MGYWVRIHVELFPNVDFEYVFLDLTKILSVWSICWIYALVPRKVVYVQDQLQESLMKNSEPKKKLFTLEKMGK